ncbi:MAG: trigger factor [Patescibacteria group bacterium]|jgi:trigger factor
MQTKLENLPKSRVKITITLTAQEWQKAYEEALVEIAKTIKLAGFRPGKVPAVMAEKHIGKAGITSEALEKAIPHYYYEAVLEHNLHPLHQPAVTVAKSDPELEFNAEVDILPTVEIKDWHNIKIKKNDAQKVTDLDVKKVLEHLRKERSQLEAVTRPAETKDFVRINFSGSVDGVKHEGMQSNEHPLVLGDNTMISGFEDQIVGMSVDEEKTFDIVFPKDYRDKTLAKKKAQFMVKLLEVKQINLPELDEKFAADFGKKNMTEIESAILEQLEAEAEEEAKNKDEVLILEELVKRTKVVLPKSIVESEIDRIIDTMKERMGANDTQFSQYLESQGKSLVKLREEANDQAIKNATIGLALGEIMKAEKIDPEDKDAVKLVLDKIKAESTK